MIAQVYGERVALWTPESEAALRQCAQYAAYGAAQPFLRFFEDESGNRLSVFDGAATLVAKGDVAETALFLQMDSTISRVRTDKTTAQRLAALWDVPLSCETVMEAPANAAAERAVQELPLARVYPVLQQGFGDSLPPFDVWYADVHHRYRRGLCRAVGVAKDGVPVACAMTVAECDTAALIGAVATAPHARGRGYASACVLTLANALHREGKRVLLSPKNEHAHRIYDRIGFTVCGEWGELQINRKA